MKVLLINPPRTYYSGSEPPAGNLPLSLLHIAAVLEKAGYKTEILDALITDVSFRKIGDVTEVDMPYGRIMEEIRRRKPDIVGITNPFTCQVENAVRVANVVKDIDPSILTVVGGSHVTVVPVEFCHRRSHFLRQEP